MRIKVIKNGIESEWFPLTKRQHKELLKNRPDAALIYIEDIYPNSPNAGTVVRLDFDVFSALTREFVLELNRLKKAMNAILISAGSTRSAQTTTRRFGSIWMRSSGAAKDAENSRPLWNSSPRFSADASC